MWLDGLTYPQWLIRFFIHLSVDDTIELCSQLLHDQHMLFVPPRRSKSTLKCTGEGGRLQVYGIQSKPSVVSHGWTDLERLSICQPETVVLFERNGLSVLVITAERSTPASCSFGKTAQRTSGLGTGRW